MSSPQTRHLPPVLLEKRSVYLHFLNARFVPRMFCALALICLFILFYFILHFHGKILKIRPLSIYVSF